MDSQSFHLNCLFVGVLDNYFGPGFPDDQDMYLGIRCPNLLVNEDPSDADTMFKHGIDSRVVLYQDLTIPAHDGREGDRENR